MREANIVDDKPPATIATALSYAPVTNDDTHFLTTNIHPGQTSENNAYCRVADSNVVFTLWKEIKALRIDVKSFFELELYIQRSTR